MNLNSPNLSYGTTHDRSTRLCPICKKAGHGALTCRHRSNFSYLINRMICRQPFLLWISLPHMRLHAFLTRVQAITWQPMIQPSPMSKSLMVLIKWEWEMAELFLSGVLVRWSSQLPFPLFRWKTFDMCQRLQLTDFLSLDFLPIMTAFFNWIVLLFLLRIDAGGKSSTAARVRTLSIPFKQNLLNLLSLHQPSPGWSERIILFLFGTHNRLGHPSSQILPDLVNN